MAIDNKMKDEKLQHDISREAVKVSPLLSGNIDKYEYLRDEEILPSGQSRTIEQAKFTYSPLEHFLKNKKKTIEEQGKKEMITIDHREEKQIKALENRVEKDFLDTNQKSTSSLFSKYF